jgi:hypothetical protein
MGGLWSDVYVVGEIDYRVLAFDRPWFGRANLCLRHLTVVTNCTPGNDTDLQPLVVYREPCQTTWFWVDNIERVPKDPLVSFRSPEQRAQAEEFNTRYMQMAAKMAVSGPNVQELKQLQMPELPRFCAIALVRTWMNRLTGNLSSSGSIMRVTIAREKPGYKYARK